MELAAILVPLFWIASLVSLICAIMVSVQMIQHNQTGLGVVCIILSLCTGIGVLIALVYGWTKSSEWQIKNLMLVFTVTFVLQFVALAGAFGAIMSIFMGEMRNMPMP